MGSRVLIMDYSTDRASGALISRWIPHGWTVEVFRPDPGASFPDPHSADHVIHSGSALSICDDAPFQSDAECFIRDAVHSGIPQMGICYGHQLLVRSLAGRTAVRRNPAGIEAGWLEVMFDPAASAAIGVPRTIRIFHSHFDEVVTLPEGAAVLAWSTRTMVQAFVDEHRMLFGCQFHPEFDRDAGNLQFSADRGLLSRNGLDWEEIVSGGPDPATDGRFFRFFLDLTWRGAGG